MDADYVPFLMNLPVQLVSKGDGPGQNAETLLAVDYVPLQISKLKALLTQQIWLLLHFQKLTRKKNACSWTYRRVLVRQKLIEVSEDRGASVFMSKSKPAADIYWTAFRFTAVRV
jgi:hypothetical protein